jgi:FtsP/CotA-like multicopper oxidase with cupredoxin domain
VSRALPLVPALAALALGCSSGEAVQPVGAQGGAGSAQRYPSTGVTRELNFTIQEMLWEVGPGAIYNGIGYNGQIPGPPIEVTAGDRVVIHLTNDTSAPHSIHTHVVEFTEANDGTEDSVVEPGESRMYTWDAVYAGTFPYHDHGDEAEGMVRGLFGAVIVHAPDEAPANEHVVVLSDFDQGEYEQLPGVADPETGEFPDAGTYHGGHQYMHTINGKAYEDAIPPFLGKVGDLSRWRIVSIGQEFHTWHIHGHRWTDPATGALTDNVQLGPGLYTTFEFQENNPGEWLVHCHVPSHMEGGMIASYIVSP